MNNRSPIDLKQPDMLQKLDKYMKPLIRPFVYKWAVTQVTITLKICIFPKNSFSLYSYMLNVDPYPSAAVIIKAAPFLFPGHLFTILFTLPVCLYRVKLWKCNYS